MGVGRCPAMFGGVEMGSDNVSSDKLLSTKRVAGGDTTTAPQITIPGTKKPAKRPVFFDRDRGRPQGFP